MNPNEAPIDVLHKSRLLSIVLGMGLVSCLGLAATSPVDGQLRFILILGAGLFLLYFLFFENPDNRNFPKLLIDQLHLSQGADWTC